MAALRAASLVRCKRAFWAMAATSSTTCVAFMSTAISPIMPIASFGWYAAIGVHVTDRLRES